MKLCIFCNTVAENDFNFCSSCGATLSDDEECEDVNVEETEQKFCPYCGIDLQEQSAVCSNCGKSLNLTTNEENPPIKVKSKNLNTFSGRFFIMEKNKVSSFIKVTAVLLFIVVFIAGIIISYTPAGSSNLFYTEYSASFNWTMALAIWGIGLIFCLLMYAVGEIIYLLQNIMANTRDHLHAYKYNEDKKD